MANEKLKHFCYRLTLREDLRDFESWTDEETNTVGVHFNYLKGMLENGKLVMAGRTVNTPMTERDMGIVILEAETEEEARSIMENDPAVKAGIMSAELFEFSLALHRKQALASE
jgi:uncharacterized protein YciI